MSISIEELAETGEEIRVLHVDDDDALLDLSKSTLESESDRLRVAVETDPRESLDRLREEDFDCVVSDFQMPKLDGLELFEAIREAGVDVPFLLYTGKGSEDIAARAITAGVSGYIQKEGGLSHYAILANRIEAVVDRYRAEQRVERSLTALEAARDGIAVFDADGTFQYVNGSYADVYGYEPAELVGNDWTHLYPEAEVERYRNQITPTLEAEGGWKGECVCLHKDGSKFKSTHSISNLEEGGHICVIHHSTVSEV